jgi:hypothetical protein
MPSPGTMPKAKCALSWNTVSGVAMTMSASSTYSHTVVRVLLDLMEEIDELLMGVAIEDQRTTVRMENDLDPPSGDRVSLACGNSSW